MTTIPTWIQIGTPTRCLKNIQTIMYKINRSERRCRDFEVDFENHKISINMNSLMKNVRKNMHFLIVILLILRFTVIEKMIYYPYQLKVILCL